MNRYVDEFLNMCCSGDVLNAVSRMSFAQKEISESMGIIKKLKPIVLKDPMKYNVVDLCAGNALTSVLAVHMLPITKAVAIDKKKRKGNYKAVKRFEYIEADITTMGIYASKEIYTMDTIIISVHPCKTANIIIDIFNETPTAALIMMPCCNSTYHDVKCNAWLKTKMSTYDLWTLHLMQNIRESEVKIVTDSYVLSPKRNIIVANKRGD